MLREVAGRWKWCFVDRARGIELQSNDDYPNPGTARAAAAAAYPDLGFVESGGSREPGVVRRPFLLLSLAALAFGALLLLVIRAK